MSRTERSRPMRAVAVTSAVIGALALAGCGAGQITQTSGQVAAVGGANGGNGLVAVRNAEIEYAEDAEGAKIYPRGGNAPLQMTIVNSGVAADRLVSVSSPAAASVEVSGESEVPGGQVLLVEGGGEAAPPAGPAEPVEPGGPAGATPTGATPTGAAEPSAEPPATSSENPATPQPPVPAEPTGEIPAEPAGGEAAGAREAQIVLTGLKDDVRAGLTYPVVFNFERGGQITIDVPVGNPAEPREDEPAE